MGWKLCTTLDALRPHKQQQQRQDTRDNKGQTFTVGATVFAKNFQPGQPNWASGTIAKRKGMFVNNVQVGEQLWTIKKKAITSQIHQEQHNWQHANYSSGFANGHIWPTISITSCADKCKWVQDLTGNVLSEIAQECSTCKLTLSVLAIVNYSKKGGVRGSLTKKDIELLPFELWPLELWGDSFFPWQLLFWGQHRKRRTAMINAAKTH